MESELAQLGLAGVVILALTYAVRTLYKEKEILQEKRLQDKVEDSKRYQKVIGRFAEAVELQNKKIQVEDDG